jgi:nucleotide-binding universal stress UspA family protein
MHVLIATTGALTPGPVVDFTTRLLAGSGKVSVITVIEVPRSFLDVLRSEEWHPLESGEPMHTWTTAEDALIARYVEERGRKLTEPVLATLRASGVEPEVLYVEGEDPARTISDTASTLDVDVVVLGATRRIFDESAWESVSARVMMESRKPVLVVPAAHRDTPDDSTEESE